MINLGEYKATYEPFHVDSAKGLLYFFLKNSWFSVVKVDRKEDEEPKYNICMIKETYLELIEKADFSTMEFSYLNLKTKKDVEEMFKIFEDTIPEPITYYELSDKEKTDVRKSIPKALLIKTVKSDNRRLLTVK